MICPNCQRQIPDDSLSCPECEELLAIQCAECGQRIQADLPSCPNCGRENLWGMRRKARAEKMKWEPSWNPEIAADLPSPGIPDGSIQRAGSAEGPPAQGAPSEPGAESPQNQGAGQDSPGKSGWAAWKIAFVAIYACLNVACVAAYFVYGAPELLITHLLFNAVFPVFILILHNRGVID